MANEIHWRHHRKQVDLYVTIRAVDDPSWDKDHQYWNDLILNFEPLTVVNWPDYALALAETPIDSFLYLGEWPVHANMPDGWYWLDVFEYDGYGTIPVPDDELVGSVLGYWDGQAFWPQDAAIAQIQRNTRLATVFATYLAGVPSGEVTDESPAADDFVTDLLSDTQDFYKDAYLLFCSGGLRDQSRKIQSYDGVQKKITLAVPFTSIPTNGDTFVILGRSE